MHGHGPRSNSTTPSGSRSGAGREQAPRGELSRSKSTTPSVRTFADPEVVMNFRESRSGADVVVVATKAKAKEEQEAQLLVRAKVICSTATGHALRQKTRSTKRRKTTKANSQDTQTRHTDKTQTTRHKRQNAQMSIQPMPLCLSVRVRDSVIALDKKVPYKIPYYTFHRKRCWRNSNPYPNPNPNPNPSPSPNPNPCPNPNPSPNPNPKP